MQKQPITVAMMVRNEEWFVARSLRSALAVSNDVLVGDMASTDRTREIASSLGARIIDVPEELMVRQGWSACRNLMNKAAKHPWVLTLDADETLSEEAIKTLNAAEWPWTTPIIITPTRTFNGTPGMSVEEAVKCTYETFPHRRMFDATKVSWCGFVHEEPVWAGTIMPAAGPIPSTEVIRNHFKLIRPDKVSKWKWMVDAQLFLRAMNNQLPRVGVNPWWFSTWVPERLAELKGLAKEFFDTHPCYEDLRGHIQW